jgi:hypothetical protein
MPRIDGHNITRGRTTGALWFSILGGPLAALSMEQLNYMITPAACHRAPVLLWRSLLHVVPATLVLITAAAAVTAWHYRAGHPRDAGTRDGRIEFMAQLGLWLSLLSILVLIAEWIPVFVLHPCQAT